MATYWKIFVVKFGTPSDNITLNTPDVVVNRWFPLKIVENELVAMIEELLWNNSR